MKVNVKPKFQEIFADEGHMLTNYKEGDESYVGFPSCICPLTCDLKHITEITIERHNELEEYFRLKEEELRKQMEENDTVKEYDR